MEHESRHRLSDALLSWLDSHLARPPVHTSSGSGTTGGRSGGFVPSGLSGSDFRVKF